MPPVFRNSPGGFSWNSSGMRGEISPEDEESGKKAVYSKAFMVRFVVKIRGKFLNKEKKPA